VPQKFRAVSRSRGEQKFQSLAAAEGNIETNLLLRARARTPCHGQLALIIFCMTSFLISRIAPLAIHFLFIS